MKKFYIVLLWYVQYKLIAAYFTNESEIHFIPCDVIVTSWHYNSFKLNSQLPYEFFLWDKFVAICNNCMLRHAWGPHYKLTSSKLSQSLITNHTE